VSIKSEVTAILSQRIESGIVRDLLDSYGKLKTCYWKSDWEDTLGKGRKFSENVFRALSYMSLGSPIKEIGIGDMGRIADKLEKLPKKQHEESIRILIPRTALLVNCFSSKRGGTHVKPLPPSLTDATVCACLCDWIVAELIRVTSSLDFQSVEPLMNEVVRRRLPLVQEFGKKEWLVVAQDLTAQDELLILLFHAKLKGLPGLSRRELGHAVQKSAPTVTNSLAELAGERKVYHYKPKDLYTITDTGEQRVEQILRDRLLQKGVRRR